MQRKLQVFVSSTYSDLIVERQAAVEAILRAGHIPAGMELFAAGSESQLQVIKRWIDDSDIYMLLLGGRYGSVDTNTGMSYTEIEYRYAIEKNEPIFAVILSDSFIDNKVRDHGKEILERHLPAKLNEFTNLVKQRISRFVNNESEIRLAVLESVLDIQNRYKLTGWIRASEVPDVSELIEQITELKEKNKKLSIEINNNNTSQKERIGDLLFEDVKNTLQNTLILIPKTVTDIDDFRSNVYELFLLFQSTLNQGVSNVKRLEPKPVEVFLYYKVSAFLRIYELMDYSNKDTSVAGTSRTTKLGNKFLAIANLKGEKSSLAYQNKKIIRT